MVQSSPAAESRFPSPPSRLFILAWGIGIGWLSALVAYLGLRSVGTSSPWIDRIHDTGHALAFGCLAVGWIISTRLVVYRKEHDWPREWLHGGGLSLLAGILLEIAQAFRPGRTANFHDVGFDLLGIIAGLALYTAWCGPSVGTTRRIHWGLGLVATLAALAPSIQAARWYYQQQSDYPHLVRWERGWAQAFLWKDDEVASQIVPRPNTWPNPSSRKCAEFVLPSLTEGSFPGCGMQLGPKNWSGYRYLVLEVENCSPLPARLQFRVHDLDHDDTFHDRFERELTLVSGYQVVRIPLDEIASAPRDRELDMTQVIGWKLYAAHPQTSFRLRIGDVRLD